jgi:hypothetical protein
MPPALSIRFLSSLLFGLWSSENAIAENGIKADTLQTIQQENTCMLIIRIKANAEHYIINNNDVLKRLKRKNNGARDININSSHHQSNPMKASYACPNNSSDAIFQRKEDGQKQYVLNIEVFTAFCSQEPFWVEIHPTSSVPFNSNCKWYSLRILIIGDA